MALNDLKDQIKEKASEVWEQIQESPTYNNLREQYETLPPRAQKGIIVGLILFAFFILISIPSSYFSASGDYVSAFNEDRQTIRKLLKASLQAGQVGGAQSPPPTAQLISQITGRLNNLRLLPEQLGSVSQIDPSSIGASLMPAGLTQEAIQVGLKQLNLRQVNEIGFQLQTIHPAVKMAGVDMTATPGNTEYYDVIFKLVRFSLPQTEDSEPSPPQREGRGG